MAKEGDLVITIDARNGRVERIDARREDPRSLDELVTGRPAREAAMLVRTAFATCGMAHAVAAHMAVEGARGEVRASRHDIRERRIIGETLSHHGWRIFIDIPRLSGQEVPTDIGPEQRQALNAFIHPGEGDAEAAARTILEWAERVVLGGTPREFLSMKTLDDLERWMRPGKSTAATLFARVMDEEPALGANDVEMMPPADDSAISALASRLEGEERFADRPELAGRPRETGPLSRQAAHPLTAAAVKEWGCGFGARAIARMLEMASLLSSLSGVDGRRHGVVQIAPGHAIGWAETGTGLAIHCVRVESEIVKSYRALLPADWNFASDGPFIRGAGSLGGDDANALDHRVRRLAASLDPGVSVRLKRPDA